MNQQEILEYNKRCAELLGYEYISEKDTFAYIPHGWWKKDTFKKPYDTENCLYDYSHLKYHSDWNWIMEVVEAIQKIVIKNDDEFCIEFYEGLPNQPETFVSVGEIEVRKVNSKEAVVETINRFLILYEQNK